MYDAMASSEPMFSKTIHRSTLWRIQNAAIQYGAADPYDILGHPSTKIYSLICIRRWNTLS